MSTRILSNVFPVRFMRLYITSVVAVIIVFVVFHFHYLNWNPGNKCNLLAKELYVNNAQERIRKDNDYLVTAISSYEFEWLLKFIDRLIAQSNGSDDFEFIIWTLNLRTCESEYLTRLRRPRIRLYRFPYHFYPLHMRQYHIIALKPIVISRTIAMYGEAIWIEPNTQLSFLLTDISRTLNHGGFVLGSATASESSPQCPVGVLALSIFRHNSFLTDWEWCAKNETCIAKVLEKSNDEATSVVDKLLEFHRKKKGLSCSTLPLISDLETKTGSYFVHESWKKKHSKECHQHDACILSGSHKFFLGCLNPILGQLRENKLKYAKRHGYVFLDETFGFHRPAPCNRVWNKIHAILKYLPDCKLLLWADTDTMFVNMEQTLEAIMKSYKVDLLLSWPPKARQFNAGVMLMRSTPSVREFFINVTIRKTWTHNWCSNFGFEQSAIADQLINTTTVKYFVEREYTLQTTCGYRGKQCDLTEKDFILHPAVVDCPNLQPFFQTFFDNHPKFF